MSTIQTPLPPVPALAIPADNEALGDEITRLAGHINAAQHRFLKLLAALIERDAWGGGGTIKSPAHWLNYRCGISLGPAREKVRVAQCLAALPLIDAAFAKGEISYSKVRAMTRVATPHNEEFLLRIAQHGTACHVEKLVRKYQRAERRCRDDQAQTQREAREFSSHYDDDGMLVFKGRLPAEEGALFLKAMDAILKQLDAQEQRQGKAFPRERFEADAEVAEDAEIRADAEAGIAQMGNGTAAAYESIAGSAAASVDVNAETIAGDMDTSKIAASHDSTAVAAYADIEASPEAEAGLESMECADAAEDAEFMDDIKQLNAAGASDVSAETLSGAPQSTYPQKRADALAQMAEHCLATAKDGAMPLPGADRCQVVVHLHADAVRKAWHLAEHSGKLPVEQAGKSAADYLDNLPAEHSGNLHAAHPGAFPYVGLHAYIEDGPALAPAAIRRLTSDASLLTVLEGDKGKVLNVGRKTRAVPPAIRKALGLRDLGCRFPGCCESKWVDAHHIQHWQDGGETSLDNLVLLCRYHHSLLHQKGYGIELDAAQNLAFITPQGRKMPQALYPQFAPPGGKSVSAGTPLDIECQNKQRGLDIDHSTAVTGWQGEAMDYDLGVDSLFRKQAAG